MLVVIFDATMRLVNTRMPYKDNLLINSYSLFMNFFIPGQTGPIFRGYYMKKNYGLKYLNYIAATLIYYLVYAMISVIFIVTGSQRYYISIPLTIIVILGSVLAARFYIKKKHALINPSPRNILFLFLATLGQVLLQTLIYYVELRSVNNHIALHQAITYSGTANLALFAALTPGAIGVREAFLLLTTKLHHISASNIVVANVIDRAVYIFYLLILGLLIGLLKVKDKLNISPKKLKEL
jgi:uncharacterized membrane protein YbhN (UPF0104 family)